MRHACLGALAALALATLAPAGAAAATPGLRDARAAASEPDMRRAEERWSRPAPRPTRPEDRAYNDGGMILENGVPVRLPPAPSIPQVWPDNTGR